jgi:pimeloyl-ACP methyl ester carboxylesterase
MTTQSLALPIYDHRPGAGPTLVFLHYWGGAARTWRPVTDRLPGRATLAIEARGWGRSRKLPGPYTLEQLARDTHEIVNDAGVTDYILVGHSLGGKVAQLVAAARPVGLAGLVLVAPAPAKPPAYVTPDFQERVSHAYDSDETTSTVLDTVLTATPLSDDVKAQIVADSRDHEPAARAEWPWHGLIQDITNEVEDVDVPVLVVAGEQDKAEPVDVLRECMMAYLKDAQLRVIPRSGHLIPLEAPDELAAFISEAAFLTKR